MDGPTDSRVLVRCSKCHAVYEQRRSVKGKDGRGGCPACEETVWLAVDIPVAETAEPVAS